MTQQHFDPGALPNGVGGDTNRTAHTKWESNFNELYSDPNIGASALREDLDALDSAAYKRSNVLDPVGISSGVPTGGIINSDSNKTYIKFADGTLIQRGVHTTAMPTGISGWAVTYPISFSGLPTVTAEFVAGNSLQRKFGIEIVSNNDFSGFVQNDAATQNVQIHWIAYGRWYP